jgi:hypothetical protein
MNAQRKGTALHLTEQDIQADLEDQALLRHYQRQSSNCTGDQYCSASDRGRTNLFLPRLKRAGHPTVVLVNIGILDDNVTILSLLETTLSKDGHLVFQHTTGESLLNAIFPPSSIIFTRFILT